MPAWGELLRSKRGVAGIAAIVVVIVIADWTNFGVSLSPARRSRLLNDPTDSVTVSVDGSVLSDETVEHVPLAAPVTARLMIDEIGLPLRSTDEVPADVPEFPANYDGTLSFSVVLDDTRELETDPEYDELVGGLADASRFEPYQFASRFSFIPGASRRVGLFGRSDELIPLFPRGPGADRSIVLPFRVRPVEAGVQVEGDFEVTLPDAPGIYDLVLGYWDQSETDPVMMSHPTHQAAVATFRIIDR